MGPFLFKLILSRSLRKRKKMERSNENTIKYKLTRETRQLVMSVIHRQKVFLGYDLVEFDRIDLQKSNKYRQRKWH